MNGPSDNVQLMKDEDLFSSIFPRLFELYQRSNKTDPKNYFNFRELYPCAFVDTEKTLARLDAESWKMLLGKALPYVAVDDPIRGYQQLWSALDEARGYDYLADHGYERIEFIETKQTKKGGPQSPDLVATKGDSTAILEVKTVNESSENLSPNAPWRHGAITVRPDLAPEFKGKLVSTIERARIQLNSFPDLTDRKIVLPVVRFDHGQKTGGHLYEELEDFIASRSMEKGLEVYHQITL